MDDSGAAQARLTDCFETMDDSAAAMPQPVGGPPGRSADRPRFRPMRDGDLDFVVAQHLYHFPHGFFARLGRSFLREYYRAFLTGEQTHAAVAELRGRPAGYLVGATAPRAHRDHVIRDHGPGLVLRGLLGMLLHPTLGYRFLRTRARLYATKLLPLRRRRADGAGEGADADGGAPAVLTHVAVVPSLQARGIGTALIDEFEEVAAEEGCSRIVLVTSTEDGAGSYYRQHGWESLGDRTTPDGLELTTFQRELPDHPRDHSGGHSVSTTIDSRRTTTT